MLFLSGQNNKILSRVSVFDKLQSPKWYEVFPRGLFFPFERRTGKKKIKKRGTCWILTVCVCQVSNGQIITLQEVRFPQCEPKVEYKTSHQHHNQRPHGRHRRQWLKSSFCKTLKGVYLLTSHVMSVIAYPGVILHCVTHW